MGGKNSTFPQDFLKAKAMGPDVVASAPQNANGAVPAPSYSGSNEQQLAESTAKGLSQNVIRPGKFNDPPSPTQGAPAPIPVTAPQPQTVNSFAPTEAVQPMATAISPTAQVIPRTWQMQPNRS